VNLKELNPLASLMATGTKVWLDGVKPDEIEKNRAWGITGATSNPTIVSKIIGRGHFRIAPDALEVLRRHPRTGNIRELQSVLKQALLRAQASVRLVGRRPSGSLGDQVAPRLHRLARVLSALGTPPSDRTIRRKSF
jgi:hypothetical protein